MLCVLNYIDEIHEIDEIVYEYDRKHSQQLVYVALSRVIFNTLFNIIVGLVVSMSDY